LEAVETRGVLARRRTAEAGPDRVDEDEVGDVEEGVGIVDELAGRVEAEPGDAAACFQRAAARLLADDPEGAVADLLEAVRRDPGWRDGLAREALLAVFDTLGVGSDLVRRGRAALAGLAGSAP
jgi:thioredoxin-like negative regulator of GroEL